MHAGIFSSGMACHFWVIISQLARNFSSQHETDENVSIEGVSEMYIGSFDLKHVRSFSGIQCTYLKIVTYKYPIKESSSIEIDETLSLRGNRSCMQSLVSLLDLTLSERKRPNSRSWTSEI